MNKKLILAFVCTLYSVSLLAQRCINITNMDLSKTSQTYGGPIKGKSVTHEPARVQGKTYTDVIGVHAKSHIKIDLHNNASRFQSTIGIADTHINYNDKSLTVIPLVDGTKIYFNTQKNAKTFVGLEDVDGKVHAGSVRFILRGDDKELYNSGIVRLGEPTKKIDISLKGIRFLDLIVEPTEDGPSGDHALWIEPAITYGEIIPSTISTNTQGKGPELNVSTIKNLTKKIQQLPQQPLPLSKTDFDWLLEPTLSKATVYTTPDRKNIILSNGMIARMFRIFPNLATLDIFNRMTDQSMLRAVSSEGSLTIDGKRWEIGGLSGQPERGYFKMDWLEDMTTQPNSFLIADFRIEEIPEEIKWARSRWALNKDKASGKRLTFVLKGEKETKDIQVELHFDLYDRLPTIRKSMEVINNGTNAIDVDAFQLEYLAFAEPESPGGTDPSIFRLPNIHIESDYACGGEFNEKETDITEKWVSDPEYTSQRNYPMITPCILDVSPKLGPDYTLGAGEKFRTFNVYEMPFDSDDRERKGLFKRRFHYTVAPWTTENPIFMHVTSSDPKVIRTAIEQCATVGYEMVIISFGSGLNAEDVSEENIHKFKELVEYGQSKGIELGCYSLLSSRWISDEVDVINPQTGKRGGMRFGSAPCLCSDWGYEYFEHIKTFIERTGMRCFEHDGSYPGDVCASTKHTYHKGLEDSQWNQFHKITELYRWMCEHGVYINVPDFYFLNGSTKTSIGYREANWSLPRDRQIIHARQLNHDGTWDKMASACWSFVPLVEYQGGGAAATLEPLHEHLYEYKTHMIQNYGAGVQACYRGPRLYDTPETQAIVTEVIQWYKKYRNILNSDIIHLRRPDARDWDGIMHVNPNENEKGFAMFFNPTNEEITRTIQLPLYYTGLDDVAKIREKEGQLQTFHLDRDYKVKLTITIPANGYTWYVIEK